MPATRGTTLLVDAGDAGAARIDVFDVAGRRVRSLWNGSLTRGTTMIAFDGNDDMARPLSSGVYFARLRQGGHTASARIVWIR
jgi:hypothetical protein